MKKKTSVKKYATGGPGPTPPPLIGSRSTGQKQTKPKKTKLREDSKNYVTKITINDKGDIGSMKTRRTIGGFLRGAPRASKAEAQAASGYKKGGSVKSKMKMGGSIKSKKK